ncbi:anthranilate synthase component I family protein [Bacillus solimangrovi]|uniref:Aminodeoxychorismate synthase component I n=1 Tax=Bacillus solimangrovi TaxID=1305675 RepID=A0A1E5LF08_9BACI|nr:anthranilate synthase component I family protein [Bacillus solimangrovi]OEH92650.1 aminodeoxychorismate synthase component I [Bacillus solimangrovi]
MQQQTNVKRRTYAKVLPFTEERWYKQYRFLSKEQPEHVLLESGRAGKYSVVGLNPIAVLEGKSNHLSILTKDETITQQGNPLHLMRDWMSKYKTPHDPKLPDFQGGAIGYISYDYVRYIEQLPISASDDLDTPDLYFLIFEDVAVYDHNTNELWLIVNREDEEVARKQLAFLLEMWQTSYNDVEEQQEWKENDSEPMRSFGQLEFEDAVRKVQQYISDGDVFQVNLSVRESRPMHTSPFHIYEKLRELNPSPYMSYLHFKDMQLVSGSPELLVKKQGDIVSTRPIAGTRSRGKNEFEDNALANELFNNEKERAEHVMLVDLERNDLGKVSEYGSVKVDQFMTIERYSHVMHLVSNVVGELRQECDAYDIVDAVFPGGTITGAPKVRTMEIIEEFEAVRRGIYTGSIGWFGFDGEMELNIVIRTLIAKGGLAHVQAGAGIVIDSIPAAEYKESLKKAKALWKAKELSEQEILTKVE